VEQIELRKLERSTVALKGRGSGGYRWQFTVDDPRLVLVERVVTEKKPRQPSLVSQRRRSTEWLRLSSMTI
jgi:hypothetical protein